MAAFIDIFPGGRRCTSCVPTRPSDGELWGCGRSQCRRQCRGGSPRGPTLGQHPPPGAARICRQFWREKSLLPRRGRAELSGVATRPCCARGQPGPVPPTA